MSRQAKLVKPTIHDMGQGLFNIVEINILASVYGVSKYGFHFSLHYVYYWVLLRIYMFDCICPEWINTTNNDDVLNVKRVLQIPEITTKRVNYLACKRLLIPVVMVIRGARTTLSFHHCVEVVDMSHIKNSLHYTRNLIRFQEIFSFFLFED